MTHLEFHCSDEKATALLKAARLYDEGVELEPVRHGRWEEYQTPRIICCSECDWGTGVDEKSNYCPNCGAKMDGGSNEK